ncbi:hypothetical protein, partial [Corynebacterium sp. HMSC22B11]|uniref:hypothetical protein n=1 Tax=Corynebacterium sp. HMSC22B11 TaxID=1581056 RepID=UPI001AF016AE
PSQTHILTLNPGSPLAGKIGVESAKPSSGGGMLDGFTSRESHPNHPHQGGLEDMRLGRHQPGINDNNGLEKI